MQIVSKEHALKILKQAIDESTPTKISNLKFTEYTGWARTVRIRVDGIFGEGSSQSKEALALVTEVLEQTTITSRYERSRQVLSYLRSLYSEVDEFWSDTGYENSVGLNHENQYQKQYSVEIKNGNCVFIVHGHDHGRMQAVARFLEHLGLETIILHERPTGGDTIIEKLESNSNADFAVVLLTPDDVGASLAERDNLHSRARQNVILELGYFLARLGRRRTVALVAEGVEIPSDYSGVIYISIDRGDEWKLLLARELKAAGLNVDMNKVL